MLDIECFTYLNRALESSISPIVILASNRGRCAVRGAEDTEPVAVHGVPPDLLARLLIIPTHAYDRDEIRTIIRVRARTEGLALAADNGDAALQRLAQHGSAVSLRYALQLLAPASVLARLGGRSEISEADVAECETLFIDARRSAQLIAGTGTSSSSSSSHGGAGAAFPSSAANYRNAAFVS
jgi:RuvB-like protein 1 (pontin 52)